MNDDALRALLADALTLSPTDQERLTKDIAQRIVEAERDTIVWRAIHQALQSFNSQVAAIRTHSQALADPR
ncbi:hypothetical protein [Armatimonas rosea]|uniref:Uncharacterized protein n=1 Tax=Armatimonas rosea TaxID=685828 RepID=A0A7W9SRP8_ARMRO|nr:hypothetical protein [Armatimonas rosea]MBB6051577.1 hypothetical protein [Armatimonas rosea]